MPSSSIHQSAGYSGQLCANVPNGHLPETPRQRLERSETSHAINDSTGSARLIFTGSAAVALSREPEYVPKLTA